MSKPNGRKPNQTPAGAAEEAKMRAKLLDRTRGMYTAMGVHEFIVPTILDAGYWHVNKGVKW